MRLSWIVALTLLFLLAGCGEEPGELVVVKPNVTPDEPVLNETIITGEPPVIKPPKLRGKEMTVLFFDLDEGEATAVQTPDGKNILIDCGRSRTAESFGSFLLQNSISQIDTLIVTSTHPDTLGGCETILQSLNVTAVYDTGIPSLRSAYKRYNTEAKKQQNYTHIREDQRIELEESQVNITAFVPFDKKGRNQEAMVIRVQYGDIDLVILGKCDLDCQKYQENVFSPAEIVRLTGSGQSINNPESLYKQLQPELAIINTLQKNLESNPDRRTKRLLYELNIENYRTDHHGTITLKTDGSSYRVVTERRLS